LALLSISAVDVDIDFIRSSNLYLLMRARSLKCEYHARLVTRQMKSCYMYIPRLKVNNR